MTICTDGNQIIQAGATKGTIGVQRDNVMSFGKVLAQDSIGLGEIKLAHLANVVVILLAQRGSVTLSFSAKMENDGAPVLHRLIRVIVPARRLLRYRLRNGLKEISHPFNESRESISLEAGSIEFVDAVEVLAMLRVAFIDRTSKSIFGQSLGETRAITLPIPVLRVDGQVSSQFALSLRYKPGESVLT
jgi:hypothetical protein